MIDHVLGHKTSLNKFQKTEIISSIFFNHNGMKQETNYKKKTRKFKNIKQHDTEQPRIQRRNQKKNFKIS